MKQLLRAKFVPVPDLHLFFLILEFKRIGHGYARGHGHDDYLWGISSLLRR